MDFPAHHRTSGPPPAPGVVGQALADLVPQQPRPAGDDTRGDAFGIVITDHRLRVLEADLTPPWLGGMTAAPGTPVTDLFPAEDAQAITVRLQRVLSNRKPLVARVQRMPRPGGSPLVVSLSIIPSTTPGQVVVTLINMTQKLDLFAASSTIGTSLDINTTARQLAEVLQPWGDVVTVSLSYSMWSGEHPEERDPRMRRAAVAPTDRSWPPGYRTTGDNIPEVPTLADGSDNALLNGLTILPDRASIERALGGDPALMRSLVPDDGPLAAAFAPLIAGDEPGQEPMLLGMVAVWRRMDGRWGPFDDDDQLALQELASRTATHFDNARRHQREHEQVLALQRRLQPAHSPSGAVEVAGAYRPTSPDSAGVGGDWFDVIRLSGGRVGLVIGDVVGHGLVAAAIMGRLRTAVQTLADTDLPPDDLLAHLDDLVVRLDTSAEETQDATALGSTCCYLVYNPVDRRCAMASAGHLPPVLIHPDGHAELVGLPTHPPLGTSREPFEVTEFTAEPGTLLGLYTDGLVEQPGADIDDGLDALIKELTSIRSAADLSTAADRAIDHLVAEQRRDDVTLLLARLAALPDEDVATYALPAGDLTAVSRARRWTTDRLDAWGLARTAAGAELVVSELVTNALRYGSGDVTLRLIRVDGSLVCEVRGACSGTPRLRRPRELDEDGRGLFVVQQIADRWGVHPSRTAEKTVWAELSVSSAGRI